MNLLTVEGLTKAYPGFSLEDVSFQVRPGRIMGLIGRNGAGKTTTLKAILNLVRPQAGRVTILDKTIPEEELACKAAVGVVFGGQDLYRHKTLQAITEVTRRFYPQWDGEAYARYLQTFALDPAKQVRQLSNGEKVKYLIALALSHRARLLLLDEPTSGLDPVSREELLHLFRALVSSGERGILFSTHVISDLEKCADDITYLQGGRVVASGEKEAVRKAFQWLKEPGETEDLPLEEIMLRMERRQHETVAL